MEIKNAIKVSREIIEEIKEHCSVKIYNAKSTLFYEGQVPIVAFLVVDGTVNLLKNRKIKSTVRQGCIVGVNELLNNLPYHFEAQIPPHTSLCFLDKSTLKEILSHDTELAKILSENAQAS